MAQWTLVAGAGKSGVAATKLLLRNGKKAILFDENMKGKLDKNSVARELGGETESFKVVLGNIANVNLDDVEEMVMSPGIPVDADFANTVRDKGIKIIGEIELAYRYEKGVVAAITGTNGKTTTTTLVGEIMKAHNENTFVVGNIGNPYTDNCDKSTETSCTVAEISSFQLETTEEFRPKVSAILNLTPDHLNRHYTLENYYLAKVDITKKQTADDYCVLNRDDAEIIKYSEKIKAKKIWFSRKQKLEEGVYIDGKDIVVRSNDKVTRVMLLEEIPIPGEHNVENYLAAIAVAYYMGVDVETIAKVGKEFKGVEHRIEFVKCVNGVNYYNDSKGTNPDAAIKGIQAMNTTTFLIGGGYDKGSTYDEWVECFPSKVKYLVLIGETAQAIERCAKQHGFNSVVIVDTLEDAVEFCSKNAKPADAVLLSPACASWDMFKSYEERGNKFKEYVMNLEE